MYSTSVPLRTTFEKTCVPAKCVCGEWAKIVISPLGPKIFLKLFSRHMYSRLNADALGGIIIPISAGTVPPYLVLFSKNLKKD